ncbi:MAG: hypothetical protein H0T57_07755 [Rubrobacter sp.]|nr:hypothetical protein [Rubrobacter sp.]
MKVKDLVEVALLYVGVPAVTLYPLGFVGLFIQLWRDNFFPYYDFNTIWNAVAIVPNTVVVGTGVQLLYFSLIATLLGVGVASLASSFLAKRRAAEKEPGNWKGWWLLYLLVLLPAAAFLAYNSVYVDTRYDVLFLAGFLAFSAGGGVLIGHVKVRGHDQWFFPGLAAAYVAAVFAALCIAALDAPTLPLVEVKAESDVLPDCSELPKDRTFVKVSEAPNLLYLYNESGFFALSVFDVQPLRYHKDCPVLRTQG